VDGGAGGRASKMTENGMGAEVVADIDGVAAAAGAAVEANGKEEDEVNDAECTAADADNAGEGTIPAAGVGVDSDVVAKEASACAAADAAGTLLKVSRLDKEPFAVRLLSAAAAASNFPASSIACLSLAEPF
jgi:hypothetical protein